MTERINTTSIEGESAVWSVTAGTIIQVGGVEGTTAVVELLARIDEDAEFASVASATVASDAFMAVQVNLPEAKLIWHGNADGDLLKAWSV